MEKDGLGFFSKIPVQIENQYRAAKHSTDTKFQKPEGCRPWAFAFLGWVHTPSLLCFFDAKNDFTNDLWRPTLLAASQNTINKELACDLARAQSLLVKIANFCDDLLLVEIFDELSADPAPAIRRRAVLLVSLVIEAEVS